jgi:hypothetical protein
MIAVTVTGGVISLLNVTGRAGAELRHRSQAYAIAQEDQSRMRGLPIPSLNKYEDTNTVTLSKTPYTVTSRASYVNSKTSELNCSAGSGSADYVKIASEVTWPTRGKRPAVLVESIVTPPTGSLDPTRGTLVVLAVNAKEVPISSVGIAGTGPTSLGSSTDSTGCAIFPDIPEGNYNITPTFGAGFIDKDGDPPAQETVGVVGGATKTHRLQYDYGGTLNVGFSVRNYSGSIVASKADAIVYVNNQMTVQKKTAGTLSGTEKSSFSLTPLFPFASSAYTVFAGCSASDPEAGEAEPSVLVPSGGSASATVRMHPAYVNVWTGRNSSNKGSAFSNADVWIEDDGCGNTRRYATNSSGQLNDPGFPWGQYDFCADTLTGSGTGRRQRISNVSVKSLSGTTINFYLGSGTSTVSESGNCP